MGADLVPSETRKGVHASKTHANSITTASKLYISDGKLANGQDALPEHAARGE